jgi:3-methyladenine DNA glycosylase/8-oxoguanine DNA glycosylase
MANEAAEVARGGVEFTLACPRVSVSDEVGEVADLARTGLSRRGEPYEAMIRAIAYQQLHAKA